MQAKIVGFLKRKVQSNEEEPSSVNPSNKFSRPSCTPSMPNKIDIDDLPWDPADRKRIIDYDPNQRDEIRRLYLQRGPCQPRGHLFPAKKIRPKDRRFVVTWFDEFRWLEYSIKADKAFCLWCYLFRDHVGKQGGNDAFVIDGFNSWNKKDRLETHEGDINSFHNRAHQKCEDLMKVKQSIAAAFHKQSDIEKQEYRTRLQGSIYAVRYILHNALPFRGHDESEESIYRGVFLETLKLIASQNELYRKAMQKAPRNCKLTSPDIQKEIVDCFSKEICKSIFEEIGNDVFGLLVDESSDVSRKEQMVVVLRYIDKYGIVKERFVGVVHVKETSASTLKSAIESLLGEHKVSLKQVRGQGYDGASNMRGEFNGLKALILRDNSSAYYIHCFAHQLQLVVVAVAKHHDGIGNFFDKLALVVNVVSGSCKRKYMVREAYKERIEEEIGNGEVETGKGKNQELSLIRAGDTRWGSYHKTMLSLKSLFPEAIKVLEYVKNEGDNALSRRQASGILTYFDTFDFVFYLHLMLHILGLTNVLSRALQRKDQNILEAVSLVEGTKRSLQSFRENGFDGLLEDVYSFCQKYNIERLDMDEVYVISRSRKTNISNRHYFKVDIFYTVLDMIIQEFGDRFSEVSTELLTNMAALSLRASFSMFDASKLIKLSEMYPMDFNHTERDHLKRELDIYYDVMHRDERFANLKGIADLAKLMVETEKHISYRYVYRLLKLALVLPIATATVERCFSTMKLVKSDLRNRMSDEFLNGCLLGAIEREALATVTDEAVMDRFQGKKNRKGHLY